MNKHTHDCHCGKNRRVCYKGCGPLEMDTHYSDPRCCAKNFLADHRGRNIVIESDRQSSGFANRVTHGSLPAL